MSDYSHFNSLLEALVEFAWDSYCEGVWYGGDEDQADEAAWKEEAKPQLQAILKNFSSR